MSNTTNREDPERILRLIRTLRYITLSVQIAPFVYTIFYIISLFISLSGNIVAQKIFDSAFYVSPFLVAAHLLYSRILHLCIWHKTACLLPLLPMVASLVDYFVVFSSRSAFFIDIVFILMFGLLLVSAYNVFFR